MRPEKKKCLGLAFAANRRIAPSVE
jgi:hypothetical protein